MQFVAGVPLECIAAVRYVIVPVCIKTCRLGFLNSSFFVPVSAVIRSILQLIPIPPPQYYCLLLLLKRIFRMLVLDYVNMDIKYEYIDTTIALILS